MPMQYKGFLSIGGTAVPCNTTGLEIELAPQFQETIHKQGHVINYADGQLKYGGGIDFPLFRGFMSTLWDFAITSRDTSKTVILSPDGTTVYTYPESGGKCKVRSLRINGNSGGVVTCSLDLVSTGRSAAGAAPTFTATTTTTSQQTPIPYWKTSFVSTTPTVFGGASDATQVVTWEVTIENNQFVLFTFDASQDAHDIQAGLMNVTGSVTLYNATTTPIPSDGGSATLTIDNDTLTLNYLVFTGYPMNISSPNEKATRICPFRVIGDTTNAPIRE